MKLGYIYNLFDNAEMLLPNILHHKPLVDYVCVIYQNISFFDNSLKTPLEPYLSKLKSQNFIDDFYLFSPDIKNDIIKNKTDKFNIGIELCKANNCSHFILADTDEFYQLYEMEKAKQIMTLFNFDSSATRMYTYYHDQNHRFAFQEDYYVPFIYKLDQRRFNLQEWPVLCDPARKLSPGKTIIFYGAITMHHFSWVRKDIALKLFNNAHFRHYINFFDLLVQHHRNWLPGEQGLTCTPDGVTHIQLIELTNNIDPYFQADIIPYSY